MPRYKNCRYIDGPPSCSGFKPKGIPTRFLKQVTITLDEYESIRLADYENLEHEEAAQKIGISRSVFTRLVNAARKKVAQALIEGAELRIEGGDYHFQKKYFRCLDCFHIFNIPIDETDPTHCPECNSTQIQNMNTSFGGRGYCRRHGSGSNNF